MQLGKYSFILGSGKQWKKAGEKVHAYIGKHVERVLRQQEQAYRSDKEMQQTGRMPNRYILLDEMAKETQDPDDLRYQLLHVFFPAHDATGIAVSDMIFHLARDHVRWAKLRREILAATDSAALSFELLKSMHYLRYVFNECESLSLIPDFPTFVDTISLATPSFSRPPPSRLSQRYHSSARWRPRWQSACTGEQRYQHCNGHSCHASRCASMGRKCRGILPREVGKGATNLGVSTILWWPAHMPCAANGIY